jgi:hypothetical protein
MLLNECVDDFPTLFFQLRGPLKNETFLKFNLKKLLDNSFLNTPPYGERNVFKKEKHFHEF